MSDAVVGGLAVIVFVVINGVPMFDGKVDWSGVEVAGAVSESAGVALAVSMPLLAVTPGDSSAVLRTGPGKGDGADGGGDSPGELFP